MTFTKKPRLHVEFDGPTSGRKDCRPVALLHGFTGSTATMWPVAHPLINVRHVVAVDLPGHGHNEVVDDFQAFGFEHTVDAVAQVLSQHQLWPVHVIGYSMGGRIAVGLAARYPDSIASLSLIGASPGLSDPVERAARRRADDELANDLLEHGLTAFVDRWMASPIFASQSRLGSDALAAARAQRLTNDPDGLAGSLRGAGTGAQPSQWHHLANIDVPVLLLAGEEDPKFRSIAIRMAAALSRATIGVVPHAGHAAHLENPNHVMQVIQKFLDQVESP